MRGRAARLAGPTIAEAMARPYNNFTLLRLALALAVIVSHSYGVTSGSVDNEPLMRSTGFTLGEHAVNGFFAVSGFLVTMSFVRRGWRDYVLARALRIVPGVVIATLVTAFALGAALTALPLRAYLADPAVWRFLAVTPTVFKSATSLPGVFAENPYPYPIAVVWTLRSGLRSRRGCRTRASTRAPTSRTARTSTAGRCSRRSCSCFPKLPPWPCLRLRSCSRWRSRPCRGSRSRSRRCR
jgi:hypothetical protein